MGFFDDIDEQIEDKAEADKDSFGAETWAPEEGDTLKGILVRADVISVQFGPAIIINVKALADSANVAEGSTTAVWCSRTMLKNAMLDGMPKLGKGIAIRYNGMQPTQDGANEFGSYTVLCEESDPEFWGDLLRRKPLEKRGAVTRDASTGDAPGTAGDGGNFFFHEGADWSAV